MLILSIKNILRIEKRVKSQECQGGWNVRSSKEIFIREG